LMTQQQIEQMVLKLSHNSSQYYIH
jgi:hypothetical protein